MVYHPTIPSLSSLPPSLKKYILKELRKYAVYTSPDADDSVHFWKDAKKAAEETYNALQRFMDNCPCIKAPKEFKNRPSRCWKSETKMKNDYLDRTFYDRGL